MIAGFKYDELVEKIGGRFKLTALIQKRLQELIRNGETIGSVGTSRAFERVVREISEGTITLLPDLGSTPTSPLS